MKPRRIKVMIKAGVVDMSGIALGNALLEKGAFYQ
jgi:phosphoribosylformylglycinamidine (FGAM) synthase PurS component